MIDKGTARLQGVLVFYLPTSITFTSTIFLERVVQMVNVLEEDVHLVSGETGEIIGTASKGERLIIRSSAQAENDKYWSPMRKNNGRFIKVMETEKKEVALRFTESPATYLALHILRGNLQMNTNLVVKENGKKYRIVDLANEMNITRQSAGVHFKKLQEANLIAEIEVRGKGKYWVINPNYYLVGEGVPLEVWKLFEKKA